ncbi:MAG: reverse transcriptase/maturase family protein [Butyrivibrio sp.]|nr:reverse transcriptase/maturase family protein [Acetatifactor muris]MCM1558743.1 reverse transcriptase/maturase family protein [Butyrivibrio sp.]
MPALQSILSEASCPESWQRFYEHKSQNRHLNAAEDKALRDFIGRRAYLPLCALWEQGCFPSTLPHKHIVNKEGTGKKRIVYSFEGDEGIFLKYIAWQLFRFDDWFCGNCYAFRRSRGVKDAIGRIRGDSRIGGQYCLKADISNYFNSIDVEKLLEKLSFVKERDSSLYDLFARILREDRVLAEDGHIIRERHGAMAGTPISPFFANVYLGDTDRYFHDNAITYFRYSDDILLFADSPEELAAYENILRLQIQELGLHLNPDKVHTAVPGEPWEFLGFCYRNGEIDLSDNTLRKTKAKIKRKAEALRRWQRKKGLAPEKAAIGLIHAMNRKFYGHPGVDDEFTWSRWFFPCLTVDTGLKELDAYLLQYIRYAVTGRHYKGNFRIRYQTVKAWGYRSLVHAYYGTSSAMQK